MRRLLLTAVLLVAVLGAGGLIAAGGSTASPRDTVRVTLDEFDLRLGTPVVDAGPVRFEAANVGRVEHEVQVIRTDRAPGDLPVGLEGVFYEEAGELVLGEPHGHGGEDHGAGGGDHGAGGEEHGAGAGAHIAPGASRTDVVTLEPGRYVVLCNLPGHYGAGQSAALTVR